MKLINYLYLAGICSCLSWADANAQEKDWADIEHYVQDNKALSQTGKNKRRVVFMGNSITEGWFKAHPAFFTENNYIGRGISGQTSYQFLLRFREDVIKLAPALVIINAGTNDVAENTRPYNEEYTFGNIESMVELAKAHGIKVILASTLPASAFWWNTSIKDAPQKIRHLNGRLQEYSRKNGIPYVDYYRAMVKSDNKTLNPAYSKDGVHPTAKGYTVMEAIIKEAIDRTLP